MLTVKLEDITVRTDLRAGDIGFVTFLHGELYQKEQGYGIPFEAYVAQGLNEFYRSYDPARSRIWMAEHNGNRVGFLLLMDRGNGAAQLRYFILRPEYRSIGLGNKLMQLFMESLKERGYRSAYLWTTSELDTAAHLYKKHGFVLTEEKSSEAFGKAVVENRYELVQSS